MKEITFGYDAREKLTKGVHLLADVVRPTLGPRANHVVLGYEFAAPKVIDDGATIAQEVEVDDVTVNAGIQLARMVAQKTNRVAGDGTTTSIILADSILMHLMEGESVLSSTADRQEKMQEAKDVVAAVIQELDEMAVPVSNDEMLLNVATISAGDKELGAAIAEGYKKLGPDAIVTAQESKKDGISVEVTKGASVGSGVPREYLKGTKESFLNCPVLILDDAVQDIAQIAEKLKDKKTMLIVADDFSDSVLDVFATNSVRGFRFLPVKSPFYAERRTSFLKDLALMVGSEVGEVGMSPRVDCSLGDTIVLGNPSQAIDDRVKELEMEEEVTRSDYTASQIRERIACLTSGVATIKVGMPTEAEQKSVMAKLEDAINASRTALKGGVVPGAGLALYNASTVKFEAHRGICQAIRAPFRQILANAGVSADNVSELISEKDVPHFGYNSETGEYGNLMELGVIDPVIVTKEALKNALSIALMVYRSEGSVVWKRQDDEQTS